MDEFEDFKLKCHEMQCLCRTCGKIYECGCIMCYHNDIEVPGYFPIEDKGKCSWSLKDDLVLGEHNN